MIHKLRGALVALAVASSWSGVQPAMAQSLTLPEMGIESAGDCRTLNVRNRANAAQVPMGCLDTSTNGFRWSGDGSSLMALPGITGAVNRTIAEKLYERLSINDFYRASDGDDYLPAWNRAMAALPDSGGTIHFPRRATCYPASAPLIAGNGSLAAPSTKQNIVVLGDGGSGTGVQNGSGNDKGPCIKYTGTAQVGAVMEFRGPMTMGLENITLESGYKSLFGTPTISTTDGLNTIFNISSMTNVVVGSYLTGPGIPDGTFVQSITGNTAVISTNATATASNVQVQFAHNEAYADRGLSLLHVYRSKVTNVGLKNARVGLRQDVYGGAQNVSIGSADNDFLNVWCENLTIAGGRNGSSCFDIGNADVGTLHKFDVARNTYTNLVGAYAGDPNAAGIVLRYADNLTFRGGMMYSQTPPGLGYALALIPPTGQGTEVVYPGEITFHGTALIGRIFRDGRWDPTKNGDFGISMWNVHSGDMLNRGNAGHGTVPSFPGFKGVDSRGVFFGWTQWRSWLDDAAGASVAYDAPATLSRKTTLTQVTGTTAETVYATHKLPANAMRSRNSKDYPNGGFPLSDAAQYAWDRIVSLKQSGNWFNSNTATNIRLQVKLGSELIFDSGLIGVGASGGYGAWRFEGELTQSGPNSQSFSGRFVMAAPGSAQGVALPVQAERVGDIVSAVDMTSDRLLTATITMSTPAFVWNTERSAATLY